VARGDGRTHRGAPRGPSWAGSLPVSSRDCDDNMLPLHTAALAAALRA